MNQLYTNGTARLQSSAHQDALLLLKARSLLNSRTGNHHGFVSSAPSPSINLGGSNLSALLEAANPSSQLISLLLKSAMAANSSGASTPPLSAPSPALQQAALNFRLPAVTGFGSYQTAAAPVPAWTVPNRATPSPPVPAQPKISTVSGEIRKRTIQGKEGISNKRRRTTKTTVSNKLPVTVVANKKATFPLPALRAHKKKQAPKPALGGFRAKWEALDKKVSASKSFKTKAQKDEFLRELFARSLNKSL